MGRTIRFYTDEQVATAVVLALRQVGIDVLSAPEAGMLGAVDEAQLQLATSLGRVLFTEDRDFVDLHYSGVSHTGIAYAHRMFYRRHCVWFDSDLGSARGLRDVRQA